MTFVKIAQRVNGDKNVTCLVISTANLLNVTNILDFVCRGALEIIMHQTAQIVSLDNTAKSAALHAHIASTVCVTVLAYVMPVKTVTMVTTAMFHVLVDV